MYSKYVFSNSILCIALFNMYFMCCFTSGNSLVKVIYFAIETFLWLFEVSYNR